MSTVGVRDNGEREKERERRGYILSMTHTHTHAEIHSRGDTEMLSSPLQPRLIENSNLLLTLNI